MVKPNVHKSLKDADTDVLKEASNKPKAIKKSALKHRTSKRKASRAKATKTSINQIATIPMAANNKKSAKHDTKKDKSVQAKNSKNTKKLSKAVYEAELERLQLELVKMQGWVKHAGLKVVVIFEGRDAAGKGGVIKRISECLNPRGCRIVALGKPTDKERTQWYFQRYVSELPAAGEIVLFDRSWYNRAGVERVMGFCAHSEYTEFMRTCPEFEHMLQRSGIILVKYWFSVSDKEQEKRFQQRIDDPTKRWKLSPMDLEARARWVEYSKAKDDMFAMTDTTNSPWYVVDADNKKRARLNCINHLLSLIPYQDLPYEPIVLPKRQDAINYKRPPKDTQHMVPTQF
ncbi:polyphosphate kinase 2 [Leptolyngbya cf. ectocarpi LEGE 11479]|uniref:ADP/GDP-polyphosphate phosphotransferase n=2 Tax=Leptolyngbya ectocarpi TaxID=1202 RepID=A0A929FBW5_LEPEC|nr:polyphosphate kinase 2 [Leptolyngbya cf. ectocarpi LEGE 11479]